jgi:multiple sugar transport system ATP-binding protein
MTLAPGASWSRAASSRVKLGDGTEVETGCPRPGCRGRTSARASAGSGAGRRPAASGATRPRVELVERLGERTLVYARLADGQPITAEDEGDSRVKDRRRGPLAIDGGAAHVFDPTAPATMPGDA